MTAMTTATATEQFGLNLMRMQLGAALQKQRLLRGLTQAELADHAGLSLKYVGEIERGEANTTLEVLERLSAAVGWNPMETLEGMREPLSEGVRTLLLEEMQLMVERLRSMTRWLQALDPASYARPPRAGIAPLLEAEHRRLKHARPPRKAHQPPADNG
jgi:transcriptional regulator with XRE-family HTH domain